MALDCRKAASNWNLVLAPDPNQPQCGSLSVRDILDEIRAVVGLVWDRDYVETSCPTLHVSRASVPAFIYYGSLVMSERLVG